MPELTHSRLKELLEYNPETGILTWKIDRGRAKAGSLAGTINAHGYVCITINGTKYQAHRLAWLYMTGEWPKEYLDHINGLRADNRLLNLREATSEENNRNASLCKNNTSGINGVSWSKARNKWRAAIKLNGKHIDIGFYDDITDAAKARKQVELDNGFHSNHGKSRILQQRGN